MTVSFYLELFVLVLAVVGAAQAATTPAGSAPPGADRTSSMTQGLNGPDDVFQLFGVDESQLRLLHDDQPLTRAEQEIMFRSLYLVTRMDPLQRFYWRLPLPAADEFTQPELAGRLSLFEIRGHVVQWEALEVSREVKARFGISQCFRVVIRPTVDSLWYEVYTPQIPQAWRASVPDGSPAWSCSCNGLLLKRSELRGASPTLLFVADRLEWHPAAPHEALQVSSGEAALGTVGMDLGRLESLPQWRPLGKPERDAFYQLIWAVRRLQDRPGAATEPLSLVDALSHPDVLAGHRGFLQGVARRALRVEIPDPDIQARFGLDHYYEIELFVPLDTTFILRDPRNGRELVYDYRFPVTVCSPSLPASMPQGERIEYPIYVDGFFFKVWAYRSEFVDQAQPTDGPPLLQPSPLVVAAQVRAFEPTSVTVPAWPTGWIMAIVFGGFLMIIATAIWYRRGDESFYNWKKRRNVPEPQQWHELTEG